MVVASKLDRYRRISTLGSGGMATVVLAEDTVLGRKVALKRMSTTADARGALRLHREALVGASLSHPNLVSIYDIFTSEDGEHVIVMEFVPGENLRDALAREGKLPVPEVLRILTGVGAALDAIHQQGIVHRDVKPANVLLGADGVVKLADLGIASAPDHTRLTSTDAVVGSFRYMAPEQLRSAPSTPAIDVYALSAVAFEALSGSKARGEPNPMALAHAIATQPPPDLRDPWPDAPPAAAELLARGMARDPGVRPRTAGELVRRLTSALEPKRIVPVAAPVRRAQPVPAAWPVRRAQPVPAAGPVRRTQPVRPPIVSYPPPRRRSPVGPLIAALALPVAAAVVLLVVLGGGSSKPHPRTLAAGHAHAKAHTSAKAAVGAGTATTSSATPAASPDVASAAAAPPVAAVESFYGLAASHNYPGAWALADPSFRSQLGGYESFQAGQSGDQSITFNSAQVLQQSSTSATVAVNTTSVRNDGTHQCAGTVDLGAVAGKWLLHQIHITCT